MFLLQMRSYRAISRRWVMVYGYYWTFNWIHYIKQLTSNWGLEDVEVNGDTVGQSTWRKDKNWVEIYDGDIVKWKQAPWWIIELDNTEYICLIERDRTWRSCKQNKDHVWFTFASEHIEVIWNEFQNPELLKS